MTDPSATLFRPPGEAWVAVSPRLALAWRISLGLTAGVVAIVIIGVALIGVPGVWVAVSAGAWVLVVGWAWWVIGRRVRSYGYAERADDLLVTCGILFRRLVIVPYGRMQLVDVVAGPIDRRLGIATVQLHTAAATSDAAIPGLTRDEAAALRDRLAARGEERSAGL